MFNYLITVMFIYLFKYMFIDFFTYMFIFIFTFMCNYFFAYMFIYLHCFTSTGKALRQNITTAYSDYTYKLSGINRPSPRLISQLLFAKDVNFTYTPNQRNLTAMSAFFGKLLSRIESSVNTSLI